MNILHTILLVNLFHECVSGFLLHWGSISSTQHMKKASTWDAFPLTFILLL